jgi:prevent-host-death family protein
MRISAAEFKARCLKLMERVARTRETIIITKRGRPVARLMPLEDQETLQPLFGCLAGTVRHEGDVVSAVEADWSAVTGEEDDLYAPSSPKPKHHVADAPAKSRNRPRRHSKRR